MCSIGTFQSVRGPCQHVCHSYTPTLLVASPENKSSEQTNTHLVARLAKGCAGAIMSRP